MKNFDLDELLDPRFCHSEPEKESPPSIAKFLLFVVILSGLLFIGEYFI